MNVEANTAVRDVNLAPPLPSLRMVWIVALAPPVAFLLCLSWSYIIGEALRYRLLDAGVPLARIAFWATEVPGYLLALPTALVGLLAVLRSTWSRQLWPAALLVAYYVPAMLLIMVACVMFSPVSIGDL